MQNDWSDISSKGKQLFELIEKPLDNFDNKWILDFKSCGLTWVGHGPCIVCFSSIN